MLTITCHFAKMALVYSVFLAFATSAQAKGGVNKRVYAGWHKQFCDTLHGANINKVYDFISRKKLTPRRQVVVGIVDSGADTTCLSLRPSLWRNRVAVTVKWRCDYSVTATPFGYYRKKIWPKIRRRSCQRAEGYPFSALFAPVPKC